MRAPLRRLSTVTADLRSGLRAARMLPIARLFANLHRLVRGFPIRGDRQRGGTHAARRGDRSRPPAHRGDSQSAHANHSATPSRTPSNRWKSVVVWASRRWQACIEVSARREAGIVSIDVADDGRGLDFQRDPSTAPRVRDFRLARRNRRDARRPDLCRCLFAPGIGAALPPGGASRRSPGLEVVRANLEQIGGSASLANRPGCGATVSLQIPLATAVVPSFILRAQDERFALPQQLVEEIVKLDARDDGVLIDVRGTLGPGNCGRASFRRGIWAC